MPCFHQTDLVFVNKWRPSLKMVAILDCLVISMYSEIAYYVLLMLLWFSKLLRKAAQQTDTHMYRLYMKDEAILKFKMAAVTGQILRGTDPQKFL